MLWTVHPTPCTALASCYPLPYPPSVHAAQRFDDSLKAVGIDYVKVRSEEEEEEQQQQQQQQ